MRCENHTTVRGALRGLVDGQMLLYGPAFDARGLHGLLRVLRGGLRPRAAMGHGPFCTISGLHGANRADHWLARSDLERGAGRAMGLTEQEIWCISSAALHNARAGGRLQHTAGKFVKGVDVVPFMCGT